MKERVWYFIDIDGCIMPNIFDNSFYQNDQEKVESIAKVYKWCAENNIALYPEFIEWYKRIILNIDKIVGTIFVTGRQENVFGWLTQYQLNPLRYHYNQFEIEYFPNKVDHNWKEYIGFKLRTIASYARFRGHFKIYDDLDFSKELENTLIELGTSFEFHLIKQKEDWKSL